MKKFPSLGDLELVSKKIKSIPNRRKEHLRKVHYGCFLLCSQAGLRISEAVKFDLENKTKKGLYRIERPKGKKERLVYVPKRVIRELRKHNWQPNSTNRFNFYHFLRKIKKELKISESTEFTPHTLRHAFTTYQAEKGMPLPLLQKLLGHSSIRTTALYWQNIYQEPNNEVGPILACKKWLESEGWPKSPPTTENFPQVPKTPKPTFTINQPVISSTNPTHANNSLSTPKTLKKTPEILTNEISPKTPKKFPLNPANKKSDQLKISQSLTITSNNEEKPAKKEAILLAEIKRLEEQLRKTAAERDNLKIGKEKAEALTQQEKQRADNYQQQLKVIIKSLYQWKKNNYYKHLEKQQEAQIEQSLKPPPNFKKWG